MKAAMDRLTRGEHLDRDEAREAALTILGGEVPESVIGGLLVALKLNGETPEEIAGFAEGMRQVKLPVGSPAQGRLVDTCGTGGDGKGTFNISTTAAIIAAGCGVPIAKHGNRGMSSRCGSADVLEALGVSIDMGPETVCRCIEDVGIGFMFAPGYHPAMKSVMGARKALGVPTIFNILGPLTNPAGAKAQVLGVNRAELLPVMGEALRELECERAFIVHGLDGMDEFTLTCPTIICELDGGRMRHYELAPEDLGLERCEPGMLAGGDAATSAGIVRGVLAGEPGPARDVSVANAAFAVVAGGAAATPAEGVELARAAVESGAAAEVLSHLVEYSRKVEADVHR